MVGLLLFLAAAAQAAEPFNPRALELVERDWVIMQWAKRLYDSNGDGIISIDEAQRVAAAFREIADGDGDGRVTTYEYDRAREFILARH